MAKQTRSLGAAEARLLATLASKDKTILTVGDAQAVTGSSLPATRLMLSGLVEKKWLIRLVRGKYLIVPLSAGEEAEYSEDWHVVAKHLIEPAAYYLSHYTALDIHEVTTQPVMTVYVSSPTRRITKEILGATYRFVYIRPQDMWGTEEVWATPHEKVATSDLERTVLDCLDRPDLCGGVGEVAKALWTKRAGFHYVKLAGYAERLGRKSVAKRLGFLLELLGTGSPETLGVLKRMVSAGYTLLDPSLPAAGRYVGSWRVRLNADPQELKAMTAT